MECIPVSTFADKVKDAEVNKEDCEIILSLGALKKLRVFNIKPGIDGSFTFSLTSSGLVALDVEKIIAQDTEGLFAYVTTAIEVAFGVTATPTNA